MVQTNRAIDRGIDSLDKELVSQKAAFCSPDLLRPVITDRFYGTMRQNKHKCKIVPEISIKIQTKPIADQLNNLPPVSVKLINRSVLEPLWDQLVRCHHYLGYQRLIGHRLKYIALIEDQPVAALS